ncbi:MAG: hypothetical protein EOO71_21140 [Myxococcaceae bacterium]|nr:MAG: hypothetical protein EOO71_21140 [Myxococcaceae bacterium]
MPNSWSDVPFLYGRLHLVGGHRSQKNTMPGHDSLTTHDVNIVATAVFRLRGEQGGGFYFHNPKVPFRVRGRMLHEFVFTEGDSRDSRGSTVDLSGSTTPGSVSLTLHPNDKYLAHLDLGGNEPCVLATKARVWETISNSGGTHTNKGTLDEEFSIRDLLSFTVPETPGQVRLDKAESLLGVFSSCDRDCAVRVSGLLRLTPDLPTFRIVDDTLDQNPIPHCRVRVLCPDGVEREYETDDEGEIFLPRTGKDVYTLVEVLQDRAPMSLSVPGTWNVDVIPDDPT